MLTGVLLRRLHTSWIIAIGCIGVLGGVIVAGQWPYGRSLWFVGVLGVVLLVIALAIGRRYVVIGALIAGACLGWWRGSASLADLSGYDGCYNIPVVVRASLSEDPVRTTSDTLELRLSRITIGENSLPGTIWVTTMPIAETVHRQDIVELHGVLRPGFGSFAGVMYRARMERVTRPVPGDVAGQVRDWFGGQVREVVDEPMVSLGMGFLAGQGSGIPLSLDDAMRTVGLTHIVVASGYNLTILVNGARRTFRRHSRFLVLFVGLGLVAGFMGMTGFTPSMVRAGVVSVLGLLAWSYGRVFNPFVLLLLVAALTVLANPQYVWGDLGWLLSFAAFAGVLIVTPAIQRYFYGDAKVGVVRQLVLETVSAQILTIPIIAFAFGEISNIALLANLLVVPLVPIAMLLVFVSGVLAALLPPIGAIVGVITQYLLGYMVWISEYLASLPWAQSIVHVGVWQVAGYYVVCVAALTAMSAMDRRSATASSSIGVSV